MSKSRLRLLIPAGVLAAAWIAAPAATSLKRYYAHAVVEDSNGVIAPWHAALNGQLDERVRIAAEIY